MPFKSQPCPHNLTICHGITRKVLSGVMKPLRTLCDASGKNDGILKTNKKY